MRIEIRSAKPWNDADAVLREYLILKNYAPEIKRFDERKAQLTITVENVTDITHVCEKINFDIIVECPSAKGKHCSLLIYDSFIE